MEVLMNGIRMEKLGSRELRLRLLQRIRSWDTGNVGAATMSKNPSIGESNDVHTVGGKSAKLSSQFVGMFGIGKFAAGNIYIGRYMETYTSPMGARIRFGREFTSRPTQLKGWYKYTRGTSIDRGDHNVEGIEKLGW